MPNTKILLTFVIGWMMIGSNIVLPGERILVFDSGDDGGGRENCQLLIFDVESGEVIAKTGVGRNTFVTLSSAADAIAVVSQYEVGGIAEQYRRLEFFRTSDLKRLEVGRLPIPTNVPMRSGSNEEFRLSPDARELVIQKLESSLTDEKPVRAPYHQVSLRRVKRDLGDEGLFDIYSAAIVVPRSQHVTFLRVADWPRIHVWNSLLSLVEVIDLKNGEILSRLRIGVADPSVELVDPILLEKPEIGDMDIRLGSKGTVVSDGGRYAYFIPGYQTLSPTPLKPSAVRKIDLQATPPQVVRQGPEPPVIVASNRAVISEPNSVIFVPKLDPRGAPTREAVQPVVTMFSTIDLNFMGEIPVPLNRLDSLAVSPDGTQLYALNTKEAKLAVIDAKTGLLRKVLDGLGRYPVTIMPLPYTAD